jgi:hypothetical protein
MRPRKVLGLCLMTLGLGLVAVSLGATFFHFALPANSVLAVVAAVLLLVWPNGSLYGTIRGMA